MEEQFEEIVSQYDINVHSLSRVRSGFLIESDKLWYLLKRAEESEKRIEYEEQVTGLLISKGYSNVDCPLRSRENLLVTENSMGERYLIKRWYQGEECSARDKGDFWRRRQIWRSFTACWRRQSFLFLPIVRRRFGYRKSWKNEPES